MLLLRNPLIEGQSSPDSGIIQSYERKGLAQNAKFSHAKAFEEDKYSALYVVNLQNFLALK